MPRSTQRRRSSSSVWPAGSTSSQPFIGRPVMSNTRAPGSARRVSCWAGSVRTMSASACTPTAMLLPHPGDVVAGGRVERHEAGVPHDAGATVDVLDGEAAGVVANRKRHAVDDVPVGAGLRRVVQDLLVLDVS